MQKYIVIYNPFASNGTGRERAAAVEAELPCGSTVVYQDLTELEDVFDYILSAGADATLILAGGDGTINRFANATGGRELPFPLHYYPIGTGNDFLKDIGSEQKLPVLNNYICGLPTVTVKGKTSLFVNGIGYGIDGYCCEVGDRLRASSDKDVNYAAIAVKGLLFHFKPSNATVTVDGVTHTYKKVWLAPAMNGRYYGGGMLVAPGQDRLDPDKKLSLVVLHGSGKLRTLIVFPGIFEGKHVEHTDIVEVLTGHDITVSFDRPTALQIDGETVLDVESYRAQSK